MFPLLCLQKALGQIELEDSVHEQPGVKIQDVQADIDRAVIPSLCDPAPAADKTVDHPDSPAPCHPSDQDSDVSQSSAPDAETVHYA